MFGHNPNTKRLRLGHSSAEGIQLYSSTKSIPTKETNITVKMISKTINILCHPKLSVKRQNWKFKFKIDIFLKHDSWLGCTGDATKGTFICNLVVLNKSYHLISSVTMKRVNYKMWNINDAKSRNLYMNIIIHDQAKKKTRTRKKSVYFKRIFLER